MGNGEQSSTAAEVGDTIWARGGYLILTSSGWRLVTLKSSSLLASPGFLGSSPHQGKPGLALL